MTTPRVTVPVEPTEAMIDFAAFHMVGGGAFTTEDRRSVIASVYRAMLTAAPVRQEGGAVDDRLNSAISKLKDWVGLIQLRKNGGCVSGNPIVDCVNDLPAIIRELEAAELEIEGAFERYEDALAACKEAPAEAGDFGDALLSFFYRHGLKVALDVSEIEALRRSALRAQPPAREDAQPVAWRRALSPIDGHFTYSNVGDDGWQPLYTHPAPDALRLAVEALEPFAAIARVIEARDRMALGKTRSDNDVIARVSWEGGLGVLTMGHLRDALTLAPNAKGWGGLYRRSEDLAALQQEGRDRG